MYTINKKILQTPIEDGKILLLEPEKGLYFEMNETSVMIYQCIQEGLNEKRILKRMLEKYDIDALQAEKDLNLYLDDLLNQKIVIKT
jgi:hypothetical protein